MPRGFVRRRKLAAIVTVVLAILCGCATYAAAVSVGDVLRGTPAQRGVESRR